MKSKFKVFTLGGREFHYNLAQILPNLIVLAVISFLTYLPGNSLPTGLQLYEAARFAVIGGLATAWNIQVPSSPKA